MNIHARFVGAFHAIILSLSAAATIMMALALLDPSFGPSELLGKRGTVTIQQLAVDDTVTTRHM